MLLAVPQLPFHDVTSPWKVIKTLLRDADYTAQCRIIGEFHKDIVEIEVQLVQSVEILALDNVSQLRIEPFHSGDSIVIDLFEI
jgi:hypothetical protein